MNKYNLSAYVRYFAARITLNLFMRKQIWPLKLQKWKFGKTFSMTHLQYKYTFSHIHLFGSLQYRETLVIFCVKQIQSSLKSTLKFAKREEGRPDLLLGAPRNSQHNVLACLVQTHCQSLKEDCWISSPPSTNSHILSHTHSLPGDHRDTKPANQLPENAAPAFWLAGRSSSHYSINAAVIVPSGHNWANYWPRVCPEEHKQPDNEAE